MMTEYIFQHHPKFDKDCENLFKQCRSLPEDLKNFKIALKDDLDENNGQIPTNNKTYFHVNKLKAMLPVFKVKRFRCKSIKKGANSGFRLVFAYDRSLSLIYFIEFYYKNNQHRDMDKKRAIKACEYICS